MNIASLAISIAVTLTCPWTQVEANMPNFIVIQPDDLPWLEAWGDAAHFDYADVTSHITKPDLGSIPNIERLRTNGLQMLQAYTASPMCGTSRYSTITGRYPSRSSYGRDMDGTNTVRRVTIPRTKLEDVTTVSDGLDCTEHNLAVEFKANGYQTGVVGKWHLHSSDNQNIFDYGDAQEDIRKCGFDFAEAIYPENLGSAWADTYTNVSISHNMEHVTSEALLFMETAIADGDPFFLYFNPTVPHGSGDVSQVLRRSDCRHTVEGLLPNKPPISYGRMGNSPNDDDCSIYRRTVLNRADTNDDHELGMIWIDDGIESIIELLEDKGQLNNTFILFQMDHGEEGKTSLYEPGIRLAQFIHYPDAFGTSGTTYDGLVSTIDIGPTMLDYAGITNHYPMDGQSWAGVVENNVTAPDRCLIFELDKDRAIRCGCNKFINIGTRSNTEDFATSLSYTLATDNLFDLCSGSNVPEQDGTLITDTTLLSSMNNILGCHLAKTDPSQTPDYMTSC